MVGFFFKAFLFLIVAVQFGCSDKFYSIADYSGVKKADVHVHIRTDRDDYARRAIKDNFKLVNIVVDGAGTWEGVRDQFKYCQIQQKSHSGLFQIISAFSVEDFHTPGWTERTISWMDSCFDQGAIGIKVWKNIGMVLKDKDGSNVMLDDARFDPVFQHILSRGKKVVGHLGEPLNCWLPLEEMTTNNDRSYFERNPQYHMYNHPDLPSYHDQMNARNRRLDKHPDMPFMGAHMASIEWNVDTLAQWFDQYPRATIDLAARMGQVFYQAKNDNQRVRDFFIKYSDRIMYATDAGDNGSGDGAQREEDLHDTWMRDWTFFTSDQLMESDLIDGSFRGIKLPRKVVDDIFYDTAERFFGFTSERKKS